MTGRIERAAARAVAGWRARAIAYLAGIAGLEVEESADSIVVRGRRLKGRWLADARLHHLRDML